MIYSLFNRENIFLLIKQIIASSLLQYIFKLDDHNNRKRKTLFISYISKVKVFISFMLISWRLSESFSGLTLGLPNFCVLAVNVFLKHFRTFSMLEQTYEVKFFMSFYWSVRLVAMTSVEKHDFYGILKLNDELFFKQITIRKQMIPIGSYQTKI